MRIYILVRMRHKSLSPRCSIIYILHIYMYIYILWPLPAEVSSYTSSKKVENRLEIYIFPLQCLSYKE